ncbi:class I lanthipeptide [Belliella marina]|uniref:Class I lanthipeptide n=1 Tax=Belliella marina TaxID=1644146 RepID=A0ABW4VHV5_9BACT
MKKRKLNLLDLDKVTIARLDEKQLEALAGGAGDPDEQDEATRCFLSKETKACNDCCNTEVVDMV